MNISDKLSKVGDNLNIYMYDNGFMVEISGRDKNEDWGTAKIMCTTIEEVSELIEEASSLPRD